tara:strand:- start:1913 stop:2695 length:783 start_codon:yes stop_codon:yes gene_type:complete
VTPGTGASVPALEHLFLGARCYDEVLELQRLHRKQILNGSGGDLLLTVEHDPGVITGGRRALAAELLLSREALEGLGVELREVERGGSWTWHGPGQLVAYPLLALQRWGLRVPDFVAGLEWAMALLAEEMLVAAAVHPEIVGLQLGQLPGQPGTWVLKPNGQLAKLGAVGVHVHRFVSLHGLALNIAPDPWGFDWIVPCGLQDVETTSLLRLVHEFGGQPSKLPDLELAAQRLAELLPSCWQSLPAQGPLCLGERSCSTR